jgi:hypothetical protein
MATYPHAYRLAYGVPSGAGDARDGTGREMCQDELTQALEAVSALPTQQQIEALTIDAKAAWERHDGIAYSALRREISRLEQTTFSTITFRRNA